MFDLSSFIAQLLFILGSATILFLLFRNLFKKTVKGKKNWLLIRLIFSLIFLLVLTLNISFDFIIVHFGYKLLGQRFRCENVG